MHMISMFSSSRPWSDNYNDDTLCLEVWNIGAAESVKKKFGNISKVEGVKDVRRWMKQIAVTQHENKLIGRTMIPLNTIPATGMTMGYSLHKKNKSISQGTIEVRMSVSSKKNTLVAQHEHRHLLRILLFHELKTSKVAPHWWCGSFSQQGEAILSQHIIQSGLSQTEAAICQWAVYIRIHQNHSLSFVLFSNLLDELIKPLQGHNLVSDEDTKLFWYSTMKLLPYCFSVIRKNQGQKADKNLVKNVTEVLTILSKIMMLKPPKDFNLFPRTLNPWIPEIEESNDLTIRDVLLTAIKVSASNWCGKIVANNRISDSSMERLQLVNKVLDLVRFDLQKVMDVFDQIFYKKVGIAYAKELYIIYQEKLSEITEVELTDITKGFKELNYTENSLNEESQTEALEQRTRIFEIYLAFQNFIVFGQDVCRIHCDSLYIKNFYKWFHGGVTYWLEIPVFKAYRMIEKAVEMDKLVPVNAAAKHSSSAEDTVFIFHYVKQQHWQQLTWPDVKGCYAFIAKMINEICRCGVFYAQKLSSKLDAMVDIKNVNENSFEVTTEWCVTISNIEYVSQELIPFTTVLGKEVVLKKLEDLKGHIKAQRCQQKLDSAINIAVDTVKSRLFDLLKALISKMATAIRTLSIEEAEFVNQDSTLVDRVMSYVDKNLSILYQQLSKENYERAINMVWEQLGNMLPDIIQTSFENRKPPSFFANLHKILNLMLVCFKTSDESTRHDGLIQAEQLLKVYGLETNDLIYQVNSDLYQEYETMTESPYGLLTVRTKFQGNTLFIEILNANIVPTASNCLCDSFVYVQLIPEDKFRNRNQPKTKTHKKTLLPLYDEVFEINLSDEQRLMENGLLLFSVKDKNLLGYNNKYIGEAFIHFRDIVDSKDPLSAHPQKHLQLCRPTNQDTLSIIALEQRQGEKPAKEFLKKFKKRMLNNNLNGFIRYTNDVLVSR